MNKFKQGEVFLNKKDGKNYTGEVLFDFGKTYMIIWHHAVGVHYLPAEIVNTYEKGYPDDSAINSPSCSLCSGLSASKQANGEAEIRKN